MSKMRAIFQALFVFAIFANVFSNCPDGWLAYHNKCYIISSGLASFGGALAMCRGLRASLVSIEDDLEDNFLLNQVREKHHPKESYWIGGNDLEVEDEYKWIETGKNMTFTKWATGQPDNRPYEDCVVMYMQTQGFWHDAPCQDDNHFICERENEAVAGTVIG